MKIIQLEGCVYEPACTNCTCWTNLLLFTHLLYPFSNCTCYDKLIPLHLIVSLELCNMLKWSQMKPGALSTSLGLVLKTDSAFNKHVKHRISRLLFLKWCTRVSNAPSCKAGSTVFRLVKLITQKKCLRLFKSMLLSGWHLFIISWFAQKHVYYSNVMEAEDRLRHEWRALDQHLAVIAPIEITFIRFIKTSYEQVRTHVGNAQRFTHYINTFYLAITVYFF